MRVLIALALCGLAVGAVGCQRRSWSDVYKEQAKRDIPKVPYLVNPRSQLPEVRLWANAERSDKNPIHKVPKGTKIAKILESKEMDRTRGGTMYKIKCVTGEVGWVPHFCVEHRHK